MNNMVYGHNDQEGIVMIEAWGNTLHQFVQTKTGKVVCEEIKNYEPWYLVHHDTNPNLNGNNFFNRMERLNSFKDMKGMYEKKVERDDFLMVSDRPSMYMIETGKTLFKGLDFNDVHTVGFDIETTSLEPENGVVKMISIVDNRGYNDVLYNEDEARLIQDFINIIQRLDPSILLTYNGFGADDEFGNTYGFDLRYLLYRAEQHGIKLILGRNYSEPVKYQIMMRLDNENKTIPMYKVFGRHCIDLRYSTMKNDASDRKLNNYKLKNVIAQYGLEKEGRVHQTIEDILEGLTSGDNDKLQATLEYCRADSEDLINLHSHICQAFFYLSQIVPQNYYKLMFTGSTSIFNALMLRPYIYNLESVPMYSTEKFEFEGAKVEANETGVFHYVGDSDLTSMYPSIQIFKNYFPDSDTLGSMREYLISLRDMRIQYKTDMQKEQASNGKNTVLYSSLKGKQLSYKLLINSAFGILSSIGYYWRDDEKGALITKMGRELIINIRDRLIELGYKITALDTDGVSYTNGKPIDIDVITKDLKYNCIPKGMYGDDEEGIESVLYKSIIVFKKKNYATLDEDGSITFKGSALTSGKTAQCIKGFINKAIRLLFDDKLTDLGIYYTKLKHDILENKLPITDFSEVNRIKRTVKSYISDKVKYEELNGKKKANLPIYELAVKTNKYLTVGDKVSTYWAKVYIEKVKTERQQVKKQELALMDTLFMVEERPKLIPTRELAWVDDYDPNNPNIYAEDYISKLDHKIEGLFLKRKMLEYDKWRDVGIFEKSIFETIFGKKIEDKYLYMYKESCKRIYIKDEETFTKWKRISLADELELMKNGEEDIFTSIQRFKTEQMVDDEPMYHPLYFDLDNKDMDEAVLDAQNIYQFFVNVLGIEKHLISIWFSGSKGFHIEVDPRPFGYKPMPRLCQINKEIAVFLASEYNISSIDIGSIYSIRRMWRMPFSIHSKTKVRKIRFHDFDNITIDNLDSYVADHQDLNSEYNAYLEHLEYIKYNASVNENCKTWFQKFIDSYNEKVKIEVIKKPSWKYNKLKDDPKCIQFLLSNSIAVSGDRNVATMTLISYYKEKGLPITEAIDRVVEWTVNIPDGLTSTTNYSKIKQNVYSVAKSIYNNDRYVFQCTFIKSLIHGRGYSCPTVCILNDD